ncbi:MAG: L-2-hydroxyglutarate oxidase [Phycisphaerales bacterium]
MQTHDVVIIGAGIVGLATAHQMLRSCPSLDLIVLEKEDRIASHQTGHNSGVIHSGIYYRPGSLKAVNCRRGRAMLLDFCREHDVPFELCGKVIVAVAESEQPVLERLHRKGLANGVDCDLIDRSRLRTLEPHAAGFAAIHVRDTGIVSFTAFCRALARRIEQMGGQIRCGVCVLEAHRRASGMMLATTAGRVSTRFVVNCAGLQSDRVARLLGQDTMLRIVPFRGEYYELTGSARLLCRNLIYPVPDPAFPFLGVHVTRTIDGSVECGPNAVLALGRESYEKDQLDIPDLAETLAYPGFWKLAARHWQSGAGEAWRSVSKAAFVRAVRRLIPAISSDQLRPAPAGIRAQALSADGTLIDDFVMVEDAGVVSICNAPSPAATSSMSIAQMISERILHRPAEPGSHTIP